LKAHILRLVRYGLVGLATNAAGYLVYLIVTWIGLGPKVTMTLLYAVGATMGYFGNRKLAFSYSGPYARSLARYAVAHLAGYGINFALLSVFVDRLHYPHQVVQAAAVFVVAAFLFFAFSFFVFPDGQEDASEHQSHR